MRKTLSSITPGNSRLMAQERTAVGRAMPVPVGGWDAVNPITSIPPDRAYLMDNWWPQQSWIEIRNGFFEYASTSTGTQVESIMSYAGQTGDKMFAASNGGIFNITAGSSSVPEIDGFNSNRFQSTNFSTTGGHFLVAVNGLDTEVYYDGSTWANMTLTDQAGHAINVCAHQNRLWFIPINSTAPEYLAVDSIAGSVTAYELGGYMTQGGSIVAMGTWSVDAGDGPDDYAVFVTSKGQVIVFRGINPDNAPTEWSLTGVYDLGQPLGYRCLAKSGPDLLVICEDGVKPLSKTMIFQRSTQIKAATTYNIQRAMNEEARAHGSLFGWELCIYPKRTMTILNVPQTEDIDAIQFVQNDLSGAWTRFTGIPALCWCIHGETPYFGAANGKIYEFDKGSTDGGGILTADLMLSYNDFGLPGINKSFGMLQPLLTVDFQTALEVGLNVDFQTDAPLYGSQLLNSFTSLWGFAYWGQSVWSTSPVNATDWLALSGEGQWASVRLKATVRHQDIESEGRWGIALWGENTWGLGLAPARLLKANGFNMTFKTGAFI